MATDTSAPLPDLIVDAGTTYTVTLDDASAVITQLVVHGDQTAGEDITQLTLQDVYLSPTTADAINPADFGGPAGQRVQSTVWFKDGPCKGVERPITYPVSPPETLTCKGTTYTVLAVPDPRFIVYVVANGPLDKSGTVIAGQRDVFNAWSQIHKALNKTAPHKVNRIRHAGRRIRRAVR